MDITNHTVASNRMKRLTVKNTKDSARAQWVCLKYVLVRQIMIRHRIIVDGNDVLENKRRKRKICCVE
jgi:hypothetical protein